MTRILAELLGANTPEFRFGLRELERVHGGPNTDIRLTTEVLHGTQAKMRSLGLDPHDTTGKELYQSLQARLVGDNARLERTLRTQAATYYSLEAKVTDGLLHALQQLPVSKRSFGLKSSIFKTLVKKQPPKRVMKQLGYRSLDSLLKHEPAAAVLAAAWTLESAAWRKSFSDQYKRLKASDFESRATSVLSLDGKRWSELSARIARQQQHSVLTFKELAAVVIVPLPAESQPPLATLATLVLALQALNDINASSTYLKLSQVQSDFGARVQLVAFGEPQLQTHLLDKTVPWQLVQRYYARLKDHFEQAEQSESFAPHLTAEEFSWHSIEKMLSAIEPSLSFWRHTAHLGLLSEHAPVSLNIVDAVLSGCNKLGYEARLVQHGQTALWHELLLRYLNPDAVERAIASETQPALAYEPVAA